jgi:hypothetical protein
MKARLVSFGLVEIDGQRYEYDVVLEGGSVRPRKKGPSKPYRERYGHTPLSPDEAIPWSAHRLIVGTGANEQLPITPELYAEADRRGVQVVALSTKAACRLLQSADPKDVAAILHVTC